MVDDHPGMKLSFSNFLLRTHLGQVVEFLDSRFVLMNLSMERLKREKFTFRQCHRIIIIITRSYAALRAAELDWIVGPGYSPGG